MRNPIIRNRRSLLSLDYSMVIGLVLLLNLRGYPNVSVTAFSTLKSSQIRQQQHQSNSQQLRVVPSNLSWSASSRLLGRTQQNKHTSRIVYQQQQHNLAAHSDTSSLDDDDESSAIIDVHHETENERLRKRDIIRTKGRQVLENTKKGLQRTLDRTTQWIHVIYQWQQRKKRSLLLAAAFACSLLVFARNVNENKYQPYSSASQPAAIERIVTRGGAHGKAATAASSSTRTSSSSARRNTKNRVKGIPDITISENDFEGKVEEEIHQALVSVEEGFESASRQTGRTIRDAAIDLYKYLDGPKSDTLLLLLATALVTPLSKKIGMSPILGFLTSGMLLGPNGFGLISGIHTTETLAELGIVFFLFEMGIELSFQRLLSMRRDVFGLGFLQFALTALTIGGFGAVVGHLPANACVVLGGGIALSSSAFVLQILKDKNQLATRFGKASFGVLLFQDLAVVPLLVVTPILAGGQGAGLVAALGSALIKAGLALGSIALTGRFVLNPLFKTVAAAQSQEAFLGVVLLTVLSMSFLTEGLGLSNTLGAFLAGVLLSETRYRYQVEAEIAPFRGVLLGLFFVTVGFEIDLKLIASNLPLVGSLVVGILSIKALVTTLLSLGFGLSLSTSQQTGLMLSQGGEFAFVAFGLARSLGILDAPTTKLMLTSVSLTMATTPFMASLGSRIAKKLEEKSDFSHYLGQDRDANEIKESTDFTVVVGYGAVGKVVCDLLDRKFIKYVGLDVNPNKAIQARNAGLPIFYGDIGRQEVAEAFNVGKASAVIVCIADRQQANRALIALRRWYPNLKIFARAVDADHASRLQNTLNVAAMVPILPEDNLLLTLPFVGAVMKALGVPSEEVNAILETKRKEVLSGRGLTRNEEEVALLQLGITPAPRKVSSTSSSTGGGSNSTSTSSSSTTSSTSTTTASNSEKKGDDEDEKDAERIVVATERRKEAEAKSPFVAQVIEEICPGSADGDDDEPCVTPKGSSSTSSSSSTTSSEDDDENGTISKPSIIDVEIETASSTPNGNNNDVVEPPQKVTV